MNLKLKNTPEQIELVKAMGSKNRATAREAQEAFAAFLGPVVRQVLTKLEQLEPCTQMYLLMRMIPRVTLSICTITKAITMSKLGRSQLLVVFRPAQLKV